MTLHMQSRPLEDRWPNNWSPDHQADTLFISYDESQKIRQVFQNVLISEDDSELLSNSCFGAKLSRCLTAENLRRVQQFGSNPLISKLIIRGLPVDHHLPRTPYKGQLANRAIPLAISIQLGIYGIANIFPNAYKSENGGRLFRHVVPASHSRNEVSSHGSKRKFGLHVDNPDLPLMPEPVCRVSGCPEFLSLLAIRSDHQVKSEVADVDHLLGELSEGIKRQLMKPEFEISRPASFGQQKLSTLPLLVNDAEGVAYLRLDTENVTPITERAAAALLMIKDLLDKPENSVPMVLLPGDFLIVRNQRVLHGRGAFEPKDNGQDRWYVRLFGQSDPNRIIAVNDHYLHIGED